MSFNKELSKDKILTRSVIFVGGSLLCAIYIFPLVFMDHYFDIEPKENSLVVLMWLASSVLYVMMIPYPYEDLYKSLKKKYVHESHRVWKGIGVFILLFLWIPLFFVLPEVL